MKIFLSSISLETGTDLQLALYYLKGYLLQSYPRVAVTIRVFTEKQRPATILKEILSSKASIVGFSCYVWNIQKTLEVCRRIKKIRPGITIVLGGPEVSPRAQEILERESAVDAVVRGEGEETFARLVRHGPKDVQGVSYRAHGAIIHNPDRQPFDGIDAIPSPYINGFIDLADKSLVDVPLETTRGCRFRCGYCYYHKNFPSVRFFSLKRVEKDLARILSYKPREVYLMDATFNADPSRAKEILRIFIRYNQGSQLHVELKMELVDREMAELLYKAKAGNIEIGIQSTNLQTLRAINRAFDKRKFQRGVRLLNAYNLSYEIQLIDVLPHQSYANLMDSLDWLYSLRPAKVVIFRLAMLNGTALREKAARYGIVYDRHPPYFASQSFDMTQEDVRRVEKLCYAMDRLYDSQVFQKTLFAFHAMTGVKISTILEDWVCWESRFKKHPVHYPEFLNKKSPLFLQYLCRKHAGMHLYKELLPGLLQELSFASSYKG